MPVPWQAPSAPGQSEESAARADHEGSALRLFGPAGAAILPRRQGLWRSDAYVAGVEAVRPGCAASHPQSLSHRRTP